MKETKREISKIKCRICGKEFHVKPYRLKYNGGKYCSRSCQNESQKTGRHVDCAYCGEKVYRTLKELNRQSKSNAYFCNKSCHCAWKNQKRKGKSKINFLKRLWGSWCNSSIKVCGTFGADANSVDPPKRPPKKVVYNFYYKKNYNQSEIAKIFNATHTSVKRWLDYYKIPVKPRTLSCGQNLNSLKNLELGKTPEVERKSAEARRMYTKEKLIQKIKAFVEKHGRIPAKNEFVKIRNSFYPNHTTFRDYFGTWNNAIKAAGYEPNECWFAAQNLFAKDGHKCYSISEIIIDDYLFENNIPHERETLYPEGQYRCDFVVNNIFIEFFGLFDAINIVPNYTEIIKKKKEMCKNYNIRLVELYEKDLYALDQSLGEKLGLRAKQKILF